MSQFFDNFGFVLVINFCRFSEKRNKRQNSRVCNQRRSRQSCSKHMAFPSNLICVRSKIRNRLRAPFRSFLVSRLITIMKNPKQQFEASGLRREIYSIIACNRTGTSRKQRKTFNCEEFEELLASAGR